MRAALIGIVLAIGCGSTEGSRSRASAPPGPPGVGGGAAGSAAGAAELAAPIARELAPVPPVIAPHVAAVTRVAIADRGGAALSLDAMGELRLWLALDGTREPVVVRAPAARQLALARDGGELVAAIVDAAGGGEVQRFDAGGALVGRLTLPVEPAIEQLAIARGTVLARRSDQTLAAYGVRGEVRGRLAAPPGVRLASILARDATAVVALDAGPGAGVRALRRIALGPRVAWGEQIELLEELSQLALSPSGRAIAGLAYDQLGRVIQLEPRQRIVAIIPPSVTLSPEDHPSIGFVDEDTVLLTSRQVLLQARRADGAWTVGPPPHGRPFPTATPVVFGDGAAIAGLGAGLAIVEPGAKFLGYRDGPAGEVRGGPLVLRSRNRLVWLDDRLRAVRVNDSTEAPSLAEISRARAVDDTHLAIAHRPAIGTINWRIAIRDVAAGSEQEVHLGGGELGNLEYDRGTRVLAVYGAQRVLRFRIAPGGAAPLRSIDDLGSIHRVFLTDPALAGGVVAVASVGATARAYTEAGSDPGLKPQGQTRTRGWIMQVDRAGRIFAVEGNQLVIYRNGKPIKQIPVRSLRRIAVTEDATSFAVIQGREVISFDANGDERWRTVVPNGVDLAWSGGQLVVSTHGGLISLGGATGQIAATACAWSFGLHDPLHAASFPGLAAPSVCGAP